MSETSSSTFLEVDPRSTKITMSTMSIEMISYSMLTIFFSESVENCKKISKDRWRRTRSSTSKIYTLAIAIITSVQLHRRRHPLRSWNWRWWRLLYVWRCSSHRHGGHLSRHAWTSARDREFFMSLLIHLVVDYNTLSLLLLLKRSSLKYVKSKSISIPLVHEAELLDNWKKKKSVEVKSWSNWVLHIWVSTTRETCIVQIRLDWSIDALVNIKKIFYQRSDALMKASHQNYPKIYSYVCVCASIWSRYCIGLHNSEDRIYYSN